MANKFGEVDWSSSDSGSDNKKKVNFKDLFLRLTPGHNEMRVVTNPFQYAMHKYKAEGDNGFGRKVVCSATKEDPTCPLCATGDKAKRKWYVGVIDRKTASYKIIDISWAVFSQITKLISNPKFGDVKKYDINIVVDPNGGATGYYTVQKYDKEPLSPEDQLIVDNIDLEQIKKLASAPSAEAVQEKIDKINEGFAGGTSFKSTAVEKSVDKAKEKLKTATKSKVVPVTDDEEFEEFDA